MPDQMSKAYKSSNCCSRYFFLWSFKYLRTANKKKHLKYEDMLQNYKYNESTIITDQLQQKWQEIVKNNPKNPSFSRALISVFWKKMLFIIIFGIIAQSLVGVSFYLMAFIIQNLTNGVSQQQSQYPTRTGLLYALIYAVILFAMMVIRHNYQQSLSINFVVARSALTTVIYRKSLKLGQRSISKISQGKIINAASSDLVVLDHGHFFILHLIIEPFVSCVHLGLMGSLIGIQVLYGFLIMIAMIFLQLAFAKCLNKARNVATKRTDQRLKLLYDTVSGIRTIKTYGWEDQIQKRIINIRQKEYNSLIWVTLLKSNAFSLLRNSGYISAGLIFYIKLFENQILEAGPSFAIIGVFNFMSIFVSLFMGYAITTIAEFKVTLDRTAKILLEQEKKLNFTRHLQNGTNGGVEFHGDNDHHDNEIQIQFNHADISWGQKLRKKNDNDDERKDDDQQLNIKKHKHIQSIVAPLKQHNLKNQQNGYDVILKDVNLKIKKGELIAVIGPVCSGKTTFLNSILGQNYILGRGAEERGSIKSNPNSKISYVQQDPFIIPDTVQNNILFGNVYDKEKFDYTAKITCIEQDLEQLAMGKDTEIGEKGVNLSGGQKSRISLARAVYSDADIYLLDDPLSAVDPKVSSALMSDVIVNQLHGKTRILVTHQLHVLARVDRILYLDQNQVLFDGGLKEFQKTDFDLSEIAGSHKQNSNKFQEDSNDQSNQQQSCNIEGMLKKMRESQRSTDQQSNQSSQLPKNGKKQPQQLSTKRTIKKSVTNLIVDENKNAQHLNCKKCCIYFNYSCRCFTLPIILTLCLIPTLLFLYISEWIRIVVRQEPEQQFKSFYRNMFLVIIFSYIGIALFRNFIVGLLTLYQTKKLHNQMVNKIVRGKVSFFDQNPVGRILNRFSKDISVGDMVLPTVFSWFFDILFRIMAIFVLICVAIPYMTILNVFIIFAIYYIRKNVLGVTKECMKLEGLSRSPISTQLGSSISGIATIRAYKQQKYFLQMFEKHVDTNAASFITFHFLSRSFGFYLDMISSILIVSFVFLSYAWRNSDNVLLLALGIQIISDLLGNLQFGTRLSSDIENYMVSINRCLEYAKLEGQALLVTQQEQQQLQQQMKTGGKVEMSKVGGNVSWIQQGSIQFDGVIMRYRQDLEPALNDLSFKIEPNMKVGIIGRTGSGKSSILQALFRMIQLNSIGNLGAAYIDGVDISTLGLHKLRRSLSIIPQSPFIFQGTIRENLNPFASREDDHKLWKALEDVKLAQFVEGLVKKLDTQCTDANSVFSTGQKQLLCLARAILNENKILVLDEATANIDMATDNIIQETIREKFKNCTVLTIAHRLATIIDSDKIIVMREGKLVETGHPFELLVKNVDDLDITGDSHLASMVKETKSHAKALFDKARECYKSRQF